jgi:phosphatidylserine/phosphatidylglycerophosphate/cardiolipin synthase-like enzyme
MDKLPLLIAEFVSDAPMETVNSFHDQIVGWDMADPSLSRVRILSGIANPQNKTTVSVILDVWEKDYPDLSSSAISLMIEAVQESRNQSNNPILDLVWTGPESSIIPLRRTDQTLLDLISSARDSLLIVSFAIYKASAIIDAIEAAIKRDVCTTIILETDDGKDRKITHSGIVTFSKNIFRLANFYTWPIENRTKDIHGHYGSLHAKIAVADENRLFVTSANLTDYAMEMNMEMGILVQGGQLPEQVKQHFEELIIRKNLTAIK